MKLFSLRKNKKTEKKKRTYPANNNVRQLRYYQKLQVLSCDPDKKFSLDVWV
ncbi:TPA: hypothetical protein ACF9ZL_004039 [Escherichia coli]